MKQFFLRDIIIKFVLILGGLALALLFSEVILSKIPLRKAPPLYTDSKGNRYLWQPNLKMTFATPSGKKRFSINSKGIRGDEFSDQQNYHILVVGGSAAECLFLDDSEAWPRLTQDIINLRGHRVWIGNVGKSGTKVSNHLPDSVSVLEQIQFFDAMILFAGINDLSVAMVDPRVKPEETPEIDKLKKGVPFYEKTALWEFSNAFKEQVFLKGNKIQDMGPNFYKTQAQERKKAILVDAMPDLSIKLFMYKVLLNAWVDIVRFRGVRPILVTQPTLWREGLTEKEKDALWFGWAPPDSDKTKRYFTVKVLSEAMDMYNRIMLDVCRERQVECVDMAKRLPQDASLFFDDCHLRESGSLLVAHILAKYLMEEAPVKLPSAQDPKSFNKDALLEASRK